jgi:polyisoprenoid-binding protein YceI
MKKLLAAVIVVVVLVVVGAGAWYFLRDDSREDLTVEGDGGSTQPTGETPDSLDGAWTVVEGGETRAQMSIVEDFKALPDHTASGETPGVTGSLTIAGTDVTEASFTVDLTQLEFSDDPGFDVANRRRALDDQGLEIAEFPEASFTLTQPIVIGEPAPDETVTAEATGELTLHGVTKEITFTVEARLQGSQIRVAAADAIPVVLADYAIEKPSAPVIASIDDEGSFDFLIVLEQA